MFDEIELNYILGAVQGALKTKDWDLTDPVDWEAVSSLKALEGKVLQLLDETDE